MLKINTKQILADSFRDLLKYQSFDKVTVQKIVENCGASRTAFYNHFKDKYELMEWIYRNDSEAIYHEVGQKIDCQSFHVKLLYYMLDNRDYYMNIDQYHGQNSIRDYITAYSIDCVESLLKKKSNCNELPEEVDMAIKVWALARTGMMFRWLQTSAREEPEKIVRTLFECMPQPLKQYY